MRPMRFDAEEELYLWIKTTAAKERKSMRELFVEAFDLLRKTKEGEMARERGGSGE